MQVANVLSLKRNISKLLNTNEGEYKGNLRWLVKNILRKREKIMKVTNKFPTPFYLIDESELKDSVVTFYNNFAKYIKNFHPYYAMKSNSHPEIVKRIINYGFGVDVSSGKELKEALSYGAKRILYTGPGKTLPEIKLAVEKNNKVTINIDSFRELEKIDIITRKLKKKIHVGVRIYTRFHGSWVKFGIPLADLAKFWRKAAICPFIELEGIQVHMSWNKTAEPYQLVLKELSDYLKKNFTTIMLGEIKFVDFGGGFLPHNSTGYYPNKLPQGNLLKIAGDFSSEHPLFKDKYYISQAVRIEDYAKGISVAIDSFIRPLVNCKFYAEPGRIICHKAMHVVLKIVDKKGNKCAITDGGINIIGWERFETEYYPVINLTNPSLKEKKFKILGSLCTPRDEWGSYCYASKIKEGDVILVPNQGAYSFSLAQNFIKPIPDVHILK